MRGVTVPRRRPIAWGAAYFIAFVVVPILALCFALDVAAYVLFERVFGVCYAVLCLFG